MKNKSADGLRGIAALNVAIAHFIAAFLPMMLHNNYPTIFAENKNPSFIFEIITSPFFTIFYNGHLAVLIFFVLSGYVLTIPYFNSEPNILSIQKRLWGRYLRLNIPIASAIAISYIFYKLDFYSNIRASEISGSINWLKTFFPLGISYITTIQEGGYQSIFFGSATLVPPLWTLKIEFIGSIFLLLFYISKPKRRIIIPITIVFLFLSVIYKGDSVFYIAIFLGSLLNLIKIKKDWNFVIFYIGLYFGAFQFECQIYNFLPDVYWEKKSFYNLIGATLITSTVINGFGRGLLETRFIQFLGRISFPLYLLHFIILNSLSCFIYLSLPQNKFFIFANFIVYIAVCFLCSKFFEKYIDKPATNLSHTFSAYIFK